MASGKDERHEQRNLQYRPKQLVVELRGEDSFGAADDHGDDREHSLWQDYERGRDNDRHICGACRSADQYERSADEDGRQGNGSKGRPDKAPQRAELTAFKVQRSVANWGLVEAEARQERQHQGPAKGDEINAVTVNAHGAGDNEMAEIAEGDASHSHSRGEKACTQ